MVSDVDIEQQLDNVLDETNFDFLGEKYEGKVRDNYVMGNTRFLITTDRLSCFDVVVATIPYKGQVLNELAVQWFGLVEDIIENHIIDVPDPNVMVVKNCQILPVEMIVRGYITGSAWRDYEAGKAVSGITLPQGLRPAQQLPEIIITPSTKAEKGSHDEPISEEEILAQGIVEPKIWEQLKEVSLALFARGQKHAEKQGLILVDTKYEFGMLGGKLVLADEIHTLDSSRYWIASDYQERFEQGESPQMLDKEPTRQWLLSKGYKGDGPIPEFTRDHRVRIARHYLDAFQKVAGRELAAQVEDAGPRVERNLREYAKSN